MAGALFSITLFSQIPTPLIVGNHELTLGPFSDQFFEGIFCQFYAIAA